MIMRFFHFTLVTVLSVVSASKWDVDTLRVLTNELDPEILEYYSNLPNQLTDIALEGIRDYLVNNNETQIAIPPVDVNFTESILGLDLINGEFKAYNGIFQNPATIVRKGNSTVTYHFLKSNLSTTIGFTDMEVYFPRYEVILGFETSGDLKLHIDVNEILMKVAITLVPCTVSLTELKLLRFEDITVDITGLGILDGLTNSIVSWVLSSYETSFSSLIENVVANKLSEVLAKTKGFCKYHSQPLQQPSSNVKRVVQCQKLSAANTYKHKYKCTF